MRCRRSLIYRELNELWYRTPVTPYVVEFLHVNETVVCCKQPAGNGRRDVKTRHVGNGMREEDSVRKDASRREYPDTTRIGGC
jgi:hypothetical protein